MNKPKSAEFCRVCAVLADNTKPLFEGSLRKLLPQIKDLTGLQLNKLKDLPQNICSECEKQIQRSHKFRKRCIQAQESFGATLCNKTVKRQDEANIETPFATKKKRKTRDKSAAEFKQESEEQTTSIEEVNLSETNVLKVEQPEVEKNTRATTVQDELLVQPKEEPKTVIDDADNNFNDSFNFLLADNDDNHSTDSDADDDDTDTLAIAAEMDLKSATSDENPLCNRNVELKPSAPPKRRRKKSPSSNANPKSDVKRKPRKKQERIEHDFICDQCGKHFNNKQHLQTHLLRHTGISPYPCKLCPKGYYAPGDLRRHMYKHTGEKPYRCKFCELCFNDNSHLLQHTRREHTNERPFVCDQCPKTFYSSCNFKAHGATHTGVRAFSCKLCNVSYKHRSHLNRHTRSVMHKQFLEKQIQNATKSK